MNKKFTAILGSYAHGLITAVTPLLMIKSTDPWAYAAAVLAGVIAPALRALDKKDHAFGLIADIAVEEANKKVKPVK